VSKPTLGLANAIIPIKATKIAKAVIAIINGARADHEKSLNSGFVKSYINPARTIQVMAQA
jgi:hypothetical protein